MGKYHFVCDTEHVWETGVPGLFVVLADELPNETPLVTIDTSKQHSFKIIGRKFFPYDLNNIRWLNQCTFPALPINPDLILQAEPPEDFRETDFDCTKAWHYPAEYAMSGAYVIHHELLTHDTIPIRPADPFVSRHLEQASLALNIMKMTHEFPAFAIYEPHSQIIQPPEEPVYIHPVEQVPMNTTPVYTTPIAMEGPLIFIGTKTYPTTDMLDIETWWQVTSGPITRNFSIMSHLLTVSGEFIAGADGLGVFPITLLNDDIIVQRHTFPDLKMDEESLWLQVGAYWLDNGERWSVTGHPNADTLLIDLAPLRTSQSDKVP